MTERQNLLLEKTRLIQRLETENRVRKNLEGRLRLQAEMDQLTGMFNRHYMTELLIRKFQRAEHDSTPFSIALIDVDHFKAVNDRYGHQVGDAVLEKVAEIIRGCVRGSNVAARWGGEEFLILFGDSNINSSRAYAERIRATIEAADFGIPGTVSISIGISGYWPGDTLESVIKKSDEALYTAKAKGRNNVVCH